MPTNPTTAQALSSAILGRNVLEWVAERRAKTRSWRLIARDLSEATDGKVDVTGEAIRQWMAQVEQPAAAS